MILITNKIRKTFKKNTSVRFYSANFAAEKWEQVRPSNFEKMKLWQRI